MSTTGGNVSVTRGAFIVLEGLDRSGKSTQVGLLEKRLKAEGREVRVMRFPGRLFLFSFSLSVFLWVMRERERDWAGVLAEVEKSWHLFAVWTREREMWEAEWEVMSLGWWWRRGHTSGGELCR